MEHEEEGRCLECGCVEILHHGLCELCEEHAYLERLKDERAEVADPRIPRSEIDRDTEERFYRGEI